LVFDAEDATVLAASFRRLADLVERLTEPHTWEGQGDLPAQLAAAFQAYGDGDVAAFDAICLTQPANAFRRTVWRTLRVQHYPISYGRLADLAGYPRAARAVGTACATNRIDLLIPCHRVIRADGTLGKYGFIPEIKRLLLDHESPGLARTPV
jgi:methylated-DNA-[protein]-cysteine S-methyltransferase